eukprot:gb/GECG01005430.1/.p1 GENE.gb/GECG01005430.1/~~gb/GECG01005430.1/.p1  ORF type:complete len:540 (+),score=55.83 gb/GECG01005430.1/:1-1620(+)
MRMMIKRPRRQLEAAGAAWHPGTHNSVDRQRLTVHRVHDDAETLGDTSNRKVQCLLSDFTDAIPSQRSDFYVRERVTRIVQLYHEDFGEEDYLFHLPRAGKQDISHRVVDSLIDGLENHSSEGLDELFDSCLKYESSSLQLLLHMRRRVLQRRRSHQENQKSLHRMDSSLVKVLSQAYKRMFLKMVSVSVDSPSYVLELLAAAESVHPTDRLWRLRQRLGYGRRVFAYSHCSHTRTLPCAFIHAALTPELAPSMGYIGKWTGSKCLNTYGEPETSFKVANFYSVGLIENALKGINIPRYLIYESVDKLRREYPSLVRFCTLSPLPVFRQWLRQTYKAVEQDDELASVLQMQSDPLLLEENMELADDILKQGGRNISGVGPSANPLARSLKVFFEILSSPLSLVPEQEGSILAQAYDIDDSNLPWDTDLWKKIEKSVCRLVGWYLCHAPRGVLNKDTVGNGYRDAGAGQSHCPVANFHMSNGAFPVRINFGANMSSKGIAESGGIMVNYEYDPSRIDENARQYVDDPLSFRKQTMHKIGS